MQRPIRMKKDWVTEQRGEGCHSHQQPVTAATLYQFTVTRSRQAWEMNTLLKVHVGTSSCVVPVGRQVTGVGGGGWGAGGLCLTLHWTPGLEQAWGWGLLRKEQPLYPLQMPPSPRTLLKCHHLSLSAGP